MKVIVDDDSVSSVAWKFIHSSSASGEGVHLSTILMLIP